MPCASLQKWPTRQEATQRSGGRLNQQFQEELLCRHGARFSQARVPNLSEKRDQRQREIEYAEMVPFPMPPAAMPASQAVQCNAPDDRQNAQCQTVDHAKQCKKMAASHRR